MSRNNNNNQKGRSKSQKTAALVASLANEIKQLKTQQGGNAKPSKNRGRGARRRAAKANTIEQPVGSGGFQSNQQGSMGARPQNKLVVGDEFIADINGSTLFAVSRYSVNPGLQVSFPRLAREAMLYEKYRFKKLVYYYKPVVNAFAPNGVGKVIFSADFDAADSAPANKQQMEDPFPHCDSLPCNEMKMALAAQDMDDTYRWHYVRFANLDANEDIKTYDVAVLNIGTVGQPSAAQIGELRVHYELELKTPVLESDLPGGGGGFIAGGGALSGANPLGAAPVLDPQSLGLLVSNASVVTFTQTGTYVLAAVYTGTVITATPGPTLSAGAALISQGGVVNAGGNTSFWSGSFVVTEIGATMTFAVTATTVTASSLRIGNAPAGSQN